MTELDSIKAALAARLPVMAKIENIPSVIVGYDDEKQRLLIRPCGEKEKWVSYSTRLLLPLDNMDYTMKKEG